MVRGGLGVLKVKCKKCPDTKKFFDKIALCGLTFGWFVVSCRYESNN